MKKCWKLERSIQRTGVPKRSLLEVSESSRTWRWRGQAPQGGYAELSAIFRARTEKEKRQVPAGLAKSVREFTTGKTRFVRLPSSLSPFCLLYLGARPWPLEASDEVEGLRLQASVFRLETLGLRLKAWDFRLETSGLKLEFVREILEENRPDKSWSRITGRDGANITPCKIFNYISNFIVTAVSDYEPIRHVFDIRVRVSKLRTQHLSKYTLWFAIK